MMDTANTPTRSGKSVDGDSAVKSTNQKNQLMQQQIAKIPILQSKIIKQRKRLRRKSRRQYQTILRQIIHANTNSGMMRE